MKKLFIYYNFILITTLVVIGFVDAKSIPELISAILFFPLGVYFGLRVLPQKSHALVFPPVPLQEVITGKSPVPKQKNKKTTKPEGIIKETSPSTKEDYEPERRKFIKLIGTAGITLFLFSLFTKKAHGAFFGSVPGPGTVALKDTSGVQIDPAQHHPTDGYKITEVDDSTPAYYGFIHKSNKWFIMKESSGAYRYTKGNSDFTNATTGWPNRANLTYNYFDLVFGS